MKQKRIVIDTARVVGVIQIVVDHPGMITISPAQDPCPHAILVHDLPDKPGWFRRLVARIRDLLWL